MSARIPSGTTYVKSIDHPAPILFLHCALFMSGNQIIGDAMFRVITFQGQENVSEPFEYTVELHGNTHRDSQHGAHTLHFSEIVGRPMTIGVQYPTDQAERDVMSARFMKLVNGTGGALERASVSLFNGIVTSFAMDQPGVYRATLKPALWKLTLTNSYRVHTHTNICDLIASLMKAHRIDYSIDALCGNSSMAQTRYQDWLQAGESDYELLRRLMAKAHIYYYVVHSATSHQVIFANRADYRHVYPDRRALRYTYTSLDELGTQQVDVISQYSYQESLTSSGVQTVFTRQEAAWEDDAVARHESFYAKSQSDVGELPFTQYKMFQYGTSDSEVSHFVESTRRSLQTSGSTLTGSSFCPFFRVGYQFALSNQPMTARPMPIQTSLDGKSFVLTSVKHNASQDGSYRCEFSAAQAEGFITPFSLAETQQGTLIATVVDHNDDNAPRDWRYYTKAPFDPQTSEMSDSAANPDTLRAMGVWVKFSTDAQAQPVWIKLAPHMQTVPEIGVSVLVTRAQDESELPEIQSTIQANGSRVIMPSGWTANTHVGNSYSTSYSDGKSIRYGQNSVADLSAAIELVTEAYASGSYRDASFSQGAGYNYSRSETMQEGLLGYSLSYGSNFSQSWAKQSHSFSAIGQSYNESVLGLYDPAAQQPVTPPPQAATAVTTNLTTVNGNSWSDAKNYGDVNSIALTQGNTVNQSSFTGDVNSTTTHVGQVNNTTTVTGSSDNTSTYNGTVSSTTTHNALVSSTTTINADSDTSNTVSGTSTTNSTTAISSNSSMTGVSTNSSMTGVQVATNLVGVTTTTDMTGVSNTTSLVGASNRTSISGATLDTTIAGSATQVSITGNSNDIKMNGPGFSFNETAEQPEINMSDVNITMIALIQIYM